MRIMMQSMIAYSGMTLKTKNHLWPATALYGIILVFSFPHGTTLPLAVGNQWVYSHYDSSHVGMAGADEPLIPGYDIACTTRVDTCTMTVKSLTKRGDSTFFSLLVSISGIMNLWTFNNSSGTNKTTYSNSKYGSSAMKKYLACNGSVFLGDASGNWTPESDKKLSFFREPDSSFSIIGFKAYFRTTTPENVTFNSATINAVKKTTTDNSNSSMWSFWNYADTICWYDSIGALSLSSEHVSGPGISGGGIGRHTNFRWTLLAFHRDSVGVLFGPSHALSLSNVHLQSKKKLVQLNPNQTNNRNAVIFSVSGRRLPIRVGKQVLIITP